MNTGNKDVFAYFLKQLKVRFTNTYINKLYEKNPRRESLFEISKMLSDYKIKNTGVKMDDKNEIHILDTPFLIEMDNNIAVIHKLTNDHVHLRKKEKDIIISIEEFKNVWNGVALLAEKTEETNEPRYIENLKKQLFKTIQKYTSMLSLSILFCIGFMANSLYTKPELLLLTLLNLTGIYIGYLLIQKQLFIPNRHADKICSVFKTGGCNDILYSSAAKFIGIIGWSEIGFSYFISNLMITVLFPQLLTYLVLINLCALPYSLWSIWYQRFKAKQWCPLCLIVQILLWVVFAVNLLFDNILLPQLSVTDILFTGIIYTTPFLIISLALPMFINEKRMQWTIMAMNELKMKPEVFDALLKHKTRYNVSLATSQIIWGNPNANMLITIVTNPHCGPCAMMHSEVKKLLDKVGNDICVQYIFLPFGKEFESSNRFLTEVYLSNKIGSDKKKVIYNEWFESGKYGREEFFNKYKFDVDVQIVDTEISRHNDWINRNNIQATPTVLINGYELPYNYQIDDIIYFLELKI